MSRNLTRRQALGVVGAAAGAALAGTRPAFAEDKKGSKGSDAGKESGKDSGSDKKTLYAAANAGKYQQEQLWGFVDASGAWVVKPQFFDVAGKPGDIMPLIATDNSGKREREAEICEIKGMRGGVFDQDLYPVAKEEGLWGYIDRTGAWAIEPAYTTACGFCEGFAAVADDEGVRFITPEGKDAFGTLDCVAMTPFVEGFAFLRRDNDGSWGCIDTKGEWALASAKDTTNPYVYDSPVIFSEGLGQHRFAFIDTSGNTVFELKENEQRMVTATDTSPWFCSFHEERCMFSGYMLDKSGTFVTKAFSNSGSGDLGTQATPSFADAGMFMEGLCCVKDPLTELYGYVDNTGAWAIKPQFTLAFGFDKELAFVGDQATDDFGFIDKNGDWKIAPRFELPRDRGSKISYTFNDEDVVYVEVAAGEDEENQPAKQGWIDKSGNWVAVW